MEEANGIGEFSYINNLNSERQTIKQLMRKVPDLFSGQGKSKGYKIKCEFRKDAVITQQKRRRNPLQLQETLEEEIEVIKGRSHQKGREK